MISYIALFLSYATGKKKKKRGPKQFYCVGLELSDKCWAQVFV